MRIGGFLLAWVIVLCPHVAIGQQLPEAGRRALLSKYPFFFDQMFTTGLGVVPLELTEVNWQGRWVLLGSDEDEFSIKSFMGGWSYLTRLLLHQGYLERSGPGLQSGDRRKTPLRVTAKFQNLAPWRASRMDGPGSLGIGLIVSRLDSIDKVEVQKANAQQVWRVLFTYNTRFVVPEVPNLFPGIKGYAVLTHDTFTEQWGVVQSGPMAQGYDDSMIRRSYWTWLRDNPSKWQTDSGRQIEASLLQASSTSATTSQQPAGAQREGPAQGGVRKLALSDAISGSGGLRTGEATLEIAPDGTRLALKFRASAPQGMRFPTPQEAPWVHLGFYDAANREIGRIDNAKVAIVETCGGQQVHETNLDGRIPPATAQVAMRVSLSMGGAVPKSCAAEAIQSPPSAPGAESGSQIARSQPSAPLPSQPSARPRITDLTAGTPNAEFFQAQEKALGRGFDAVWSAAKQVFNRRELGSTSVDQVRTEDRDRGVLITEATVHVRLIGGNLRRQYFVVLEPVSTGTTRVTVKGFCYNQRGQQWVTALPRDRCSAGFIQDLERQLEKSQ